MGYAMFGLFDTIFPIFFFLVFGLVLSIFVVTAVRSLREKRHNDAAPRLAVAATVLGKRTNVSHHHHRGANDMDYYTTDSTYFVTFGVESGDRMELRVSGREYGMLIEGDRGTLRFQGTRYLGFERT